jgi:hypothetical protein
MSFTAERLGFVKLPGLGSSDSGAIGRMAALALPFRAVCFAISSGGIAVITNGLKK